MKLPSVLNMLIRFDRRLEMSCLFPDGVRNPFETGFELDS
jgi:hypothetical protein